MGLGIVASSLLALVGGIVLGGLVSLFARFLYKQQSSSSVTTPQLVGRTAQVIVSIAPGSLGQVSCRVGEERVEKLARARDNREIKAGVTCSRRGGCRRFSHRQSINEALDSIQ